MMKLPKIHQNAMSKYSHETSQQPWTCYKLPALTSTRLSLEAERSKQNPQTDSHQSQEKTILSGAVVEKKIRLRPDLTQWDITSPRSLKSQAPKIHQAEQLTNNNNQPSKSYVPDKSSDGSYVNEELLGLYNFVIHSLLRALGPYAKLFIQLQAECDRKEEFIQITQPLKLHRRRRYRFRSNKRRRSKQKSAFGAYSGFNRRYSEFSHILSSNSGPATLSAQSSTRNYFIPNLNLETYNSRTVDQLYRQYVQTAASGTSPSASRRSIRPLQRDAASNVPRFIGDFLLVPPPTERDTSIPSTRTPPASVNGISDGVGFQELSESLFQEVAESEVKVVSIARRETFPSLSIDNSLLPKRDIIAPKTGILITGSESVLANLYEKHVVRKVSEDKKLTFTDDRDQSDENDGSSSIEKYRYDESGRSEPSNGSDEVPKEAVGSASSGVREGPSGSEGEGDYSDEEEEEECPDEKYILPVNCAPKRSKKKPTVPLSPFSQDRPKVVIPQHKLPERVRKESTQVLEFKKGDVTDKPWLKKPFEPKKRPKPPELFYSSSSIQTVRDELIDSVILGELINEQSFESISDIFNELLADVSNGVEIQQSETVRFGMLGEVFFETAVEMKEEIFMEEIAQAQQEEIMTETMQELLNELITEVIEDPTEPATVQLAEDYLDQVVTDMIREVANEVRTEASDMYNKVLHSIMTDVCNEVMVDELEAKLGVEAIELSMSLQAEVIEEMVREVCEEAILEEEKDKVIMGVVNDLVDELIRDERRQLISDAMAKARRERRPLKVRVPPIPSFPPTPEPVEPLGTFPRIEMEVPALPEFVETKVPVRNTSRKTSIMFEPRAPPEPAIKVRKKPPKLRKRMTSQFPLSKHQKRVVKEDDYEYDEEVDFHDPLEFLAKYCIINTDLVPRYEAIYVKVVKERQANDNKKGIVPPQRGKLSLREQIERLDFSLDIYHQKAIEMQQEIKKAKEEHARLQYLLDSGEHISKEIKRRKLDRLKRRMRKPTEYIRIPKDHEVEEKIRNEIYEQMKVVANKSYKAKSVCDEFTKRVEKLDVERRKVIERLRHGSTSPVDMTDNIEEIMQEKEPDMNVVDLAKSLKMLHNNDITDKEIEFVKNVLDIPGRPKINFKLFTIIAALSERITSLDDLVKNLINSMSIRALEVKMERCKEMFFLLTDNNPDFDANEVSINTLATELAAGGLTEEHEKMVRQRFNRNGRGTVNFLDFITYIPLFVHIHDKIVSDPLSSQRNL